MCRCQGKISNFVSLLSLSFHQIFIFILLFLYLYFILYFTFIIYVLVLVNCNNTASNEPYDIWKQKMWCALQSVCWTWHLNGHISYGLINWPIYIGLLLSKMCHKCDTIRKLTHYLSIQILLSCVCHPQFSANKLTYCTGTVLGSLALQFSAVVR